MLAKKNNHGPELEAKLKKRVKAANKSGRLDLSTTPNCQFNFKYVPSLVYQTFGKNKEQQHTLAEQKKKEEEAATVVEKKKEEDDVVLIKVLGKCALNEQSGSVNRITTYINMTLTERFKVNVEGHAVGNWNDIHGLSYINAPIVQF